MRSSDFTFPTGDNWCVEYNSSAALLLKHAHRTMVNSEKRIGNLQTRGIFTQRALDGTCKAQATPIWPLSQTRRHNRNPCTRAGITAAKGACFRRRATWYATSAKSPIRAADLPARDAVPPSTAARRATNTSPRSAVCSLAATRRSPSTDKRQEENENKKKMEKGKEKANSKIDRDKEVRKEKHPTCRSFFFF